MTTITHEEEEVHEEECHKRSVEVEAKVKDEIGLSKSMYLLF